MTSAVLVFYVTRPEPKSPVPTAPSNDPRHRRLPSSNEGRRRRHQSKRGGQPPAGGETACHEWQRRAAPPALVAVKPKTATPRAIP
jgi:hypothetical protein